MRKTKVKISYSDGRIILDVNGHTKTHVCVGVSAIVQTAILGIEEIARQYPNELEVEVEFDDTQTKRESEVID